MQDDQLDLAAALLARDPSASLARVAESAGVGRATLARHFPRREDLLRALALRSLRAVDEALDGLEARSTDAVDYLVRSFEALVPLGASFHFLHAEIAVLADREFRAELDRQLADAAELVRALKREGAIERSVPEAWAVATMDALLYAAWQTVTDGELSARDAARFASDTFLMGLAPREVFS